ncbi:methyl-accepting chemotaxis protein (plasmid) [Burkholderia gladioli]|uniref:methyl-accepting chemotaxis protein n=1 Tax=Burkholderia gladioli TaxID=28095 RepID=UPI0013649265|nr:methyl-accepting chemotaxis protein [Burkholderia gladioli]KAF1065623.1 Methyl-accepting chemotaxis protein McpA [Burkholderia gladioli]WAG17894.1 methyl-accepting chemotaxis protein [Burkholderia gladioli]
MISSLRTRVVFACIALVVFSVLASTATSYLIAKSSLEAAIDRDLTSSANEHAEAISQWISGKRQMIASLQDIVLTPDAMPMLQQIAVAGGFFDVGVGYPDKSAKFNDWPNPPSSYDPTSRPWYQAAVQSGRPVAIPYVSTSGALLVGLGIPVIRAGVVKAVLDGNISLDSVVENVASIHPTPSSFGMLIDHSGRVIAHSDPKLRLKPVTDIAPDFAGIASASAGPSNAPVKVLVDGCTKLVRVQSVPGTDWYIAIALDQNEATAAMRSLLRASLIALIFIVGIASVIGATITMSSLRRLGQVCRAMSEIGSGEGDLTRRLPEWGRDEVGDIARSFNRFVGKLQHVMHEIRGASESVRAAANEIAAASRDLSSRTESAAASLQQTAASVEQISSTVDQSAAAALEADQRSGIATQMASRGGEVVAEAVGTMSEIEAASDQIGSIISVIDGIAFQTNILALNAAVEAARAGDQGRGFAVVAHEVRSLAQRSAQAAREVKHLVEETASRVEAGSSLVYRAGETMGKIVANAADVQSVVSGIARSSAEQTRGIQEINRAVMQLDEMVQQNAALVEESAAASAALQAQANALTSTISRFTID